MCGKVRFEVTEPLVGSLFCHCKRCQRRSGSAFAVTALTQKGTFRFTEGEELVSHYDPGDGGWIKSWCSACGGHLISANSEAAEMISVRMGAFDDDPGVRPAAHQFTDYAAPWLPLPDDGLPRFPERMAAGMRDAGPPAAD
jgi:hypothetical protein